MKGVALKKAEIRENTEKLKSSFGQQVIVD